jgi:uncharacterized protein (TIGR03492 family)
MKLLCLSNGHGEDAIAMRILRELQQHDLVEIAALPIVGEGKAYTDIPIIGRVQAMPSGGFIYMDGRQLMRDMQGGLLQLTLAQLKIVRAWASAGKANQGHFVLAVGDIVPLLFAWLSGLPFAFVGTAKSEYYLRDETKSLPREFWWQQFEGWSGSVYHPWERWLMSHPRCKAVFPRDGLTAKVLQQFAIPAFDLGNPMMDELEVSERVSPVPLSDKALVIVLLPGSRAPEAYANWQQLLLATQSVIEAFAERSLVFLGAIAPSLSLESLQEQLVIKGWSLQTEDQASQLTFTYKQATLILSQQSFQDFLQQADLAIAMAGTATEQFVGLGKPAIAIPGQGPQFTPRFAEAQTRLLGPSLTLVKRPAQVGEIVRSLLSNPDYLQQISENGQHRMGTPGAAQRIAVQVMQCLQQA